MKHQGKVLTLQEIMENRSSKYKFIDFEEAVDEAADKYEKTFGLDANGTESIDFLEGAKWQQERSYTEKEVRDIVWESRKFFHDYKDTPFNKVRDVFYGWFEQFKKK